ncbi:MAG: hypothetical protein EHM70_04035 [Chloroflexota bacterium]|nr:MAG: hypothetical protein EHM70_04035 [Chloroflexota bacterium]
MSEPKSKSNAERRTSPKTISKRQFDSETAALQSLRLIAAPNPKDDLSDEELDALCKDTTHSSEIIQHLIEYIKSI